jgi:uncharacterized integral membrane protein
MNAVVDIERKINRTRFRDFRAARWAGRGARYGFVIGLFLGLILAIVNFVNTVQKPSWDFGQDFLFPLVSAVLGSAFIGALLGAAGGILAIGVFRPIWVAVFRSIDDWEQEYGDRKPRLPPLGPSAQDVG